MRSPLTVAVAQPTCVPLAVETNARSHAAMVRQARARVVVFPELSLTGYELAAQAVEPDDEALSSLVEACARTGAVALVGAPTARSDGARYLSTLLVDGTGAEVVYRKMYPGVAESVYFMAGAVPAVVEVDGWRLGLGICRDTGIDEQPAATAALGIDGYLAGVVNTPSEVGVQDARAVGIARRFGVFVAFAGFAGPTGGGYPETAGRSGIWSARGELLARADETAGALARATLT